MLSNIRQSRWSPRTGPVIDGAGNHLPTVVRTTMLTAEQQEAYATHFRISEISNLLRQPDNRLGTSIHVSNPLKCRAKSWSTPEYDSAGRRTNTPVQCYRRHLEGERRQLITELTALMPNYQPPSDYRRLMIFTEQLFMPSKHEHPNVNFIGQILGPRGASLKELQERTGANIRIRGEGSVKAGKERYTKKQEPGPFGTSYRGNNDHQHQALHVIITADEPSKVANAKSRIQKIINDAISKPDWQNDRKLTQIRDLAIINGTFRDDEDFGRSQLIGCNQSSPLTAHSPLSVEDNKGDMKQTDTQKSTNLPPWHRRRQAEIQDLTPADIDLEVDQWLQDVGVGRG